MCHQSRLLLPCVRCALLIGILCMICTNILAQKDASQGHQNLSEVKLPSHFTLTYRYKITKNLSETDRALSLNITKQRLDNAVQRGLIKSDQASQRFREAEKTLKVSGTPENLLVTFSGNNDKTLIRVKDKTDVITAVLDNSKTYIFSRKQNTLMIESGLRIFALGPIVVPGTNLPHLPFVRDARIKSDDARIKSDKVLPSGWIRVGVPLYTFSAGGSRSVTFALGQAKSIVDQEVLKFTSVVVGDLNHPLQRIDLSDHQKFGDVWIAKRGRWEEFRPASTQSEQQKTQVVTSCEFSLLEATEQSLDANSFIPEKTISDVNAGTQASKVYLNDGSGIIGFLYDPLKGSFEQQASRQKALLETIPKTKSPKRPTSLSGIFLLVSIFWVLGGWVRWRRRKISQQ